MSTSAKGYVEPDVRGVLVPALKLLGDAWEAGLDVVLPPKPATSRAASELRVRLPLALAGSGLPSELGGRGLREMTCSSTLCSRWSMVDSGLLVAASRAVSPLRDLLLTRSG